MLSTFFTFLARWRECWSWTGPRRDLPATAPWTSGPASSTTCRSSSSTRWHKHTVIFTHYTSELLAREWEGRGGGKADEWNVVGSCPETYFFTDGACRWQHRNANKYVPPIWKWFLLLFLLHFFMSTWLFFRSVAHGSADVKDRSLFLHFFNFGWNIAKCVWTMLLMSCRIKIRSQCFVVWS